jgi:hypothetical protein
MYGYIVNIEDYTNTRIQFVFLQLRKIREKCSTIFLNHLENRQNYGKM